MRRAAKVDLNHVEIVEALRRYGRSVFSTHGVGKGVPDIVVGYQGVNYLLEIKSGKNKPHECQNDFAAKWVGGPVRVVRSIEEAIKATE